MKKKKQQLILFFGCTVFMIHGQPVPDSWVWFEIELKQ